MTRLWLLACSCVALAFSASAAYEHALYEAVDLAGAWEMAYRKDEVTGETPPAFVGETIAQAVPAYWEDLPKFASFALPFVPETFPMRKRTHTLVPGQIKGTFLYRRKVKLAHVGAACLAFEIARNNVSAWVNGKFVGRHCGFLTPFELSVPAGVLVVGENEIVLAVDNGPVPGLRKNGKVRGCGGGTTSRAIFQNTGGLAGYCELRVLKPGPQDVYVTTAADLRSFTVHVTSSEAFSWRILDGAKVLRQGRASGDFTESTDGLTFWSPEQPKRYQLEIETTGGVCRRKFGIRRLMAVGEKLQLNGNPVYLRGICDHCYYAKTLHLPTDIDYYRMVVAKRKELGFNFVRFHTYVPPEAFLEAMDELGYLAHIETPHTPSPETYAEVVAFARRHPCAVIYCAGNEDNIDEDLEAGLEQYAAAVHQGSDALFSPISALRHTEYSLDRKTDTIVKEPFPHNPDRMARLARYSDLFTSFQLGYVSYGSLDSGSAELLDRMGDAYCGKPRTSHEICIDGSYVDLSLEKLYPPDSPFLKTGIYAGIRRQLEQKGLLDRADLYYRNSGEWMWRIRKHCFEKMRASARTQGYDFLGDINTHWHTCGYSVGMMDEFYRLKPGETVENVRRYNSAAVVLCDLGNDFVFTAGTTKRVGFKVSNYAAEAAAATLCVSLETADGQVVQRQTIPCGALPMGEVCPLSAVDMALPDAARPGKYWLKAELSSQSFTAANQWEIYAFPRVAPAEPPADVVVINKNRREKMLAALAAGKRVVVFGGGPFKALPTSFRIGLAGRSSGNYATVIQKDHPIFADFPHEGYCGWQFRRLMDQGQAIQLEAAVPFDPIVDIASSVKVVIRQALMFEYQVGAGRLLVCGLRFRDEDPAAAYLKDRILAYAAGASFAPRHTITAAQLEAIMDAPLVTGSADTNRARDTNAN